jgi:hypothetical protein
MAAQTHFQTRVVVERRPLEAGHRRQVVVAVVFSISIAQVHLPVFLKKKKKKKL